MVYEVQTYVPGVPPARGAGVRRHDRRRVFVEVEGAGDYLPKYAGNLDIMTAAAARVGALTAENERPARSTGSTG